MSEISNTAPIPGASCPRLSVIILAFKRRQEVRSTLQIVLGYRDYAADRLEIIVVDNASGDGTSDMVVREFPQVKCLALEKNCGIAGWNRGFAVATGDYFLVLDDDSAPLNGIREALEYLEVNTRVDILACKVIGGAFPTANFPIRDKQEWVGFIGCGAIIRRSLYQRIGGYAEWMFIYAHEWEYGLRCLNAGFQIHYFEGCVVEHRAAPANRSPRRLIIYTVRNELLIIYKHFPKRRFTYYWRTFGTLALHYRPVGIRAVPYLLEGLWGFLTDARHLPRTFVKPEVQDQYTSHLETTQPLIPRLARKLGRVLRILPPLPAGTPIPKTR
jgi:GT2 family glycosyltransferase